MGKPTGFLEIERQDRTYEPIDERLKTWNEFVQPLPAPAVARQAARCMDCGIPFCHQGCPVNNQIPDFNNLVYRDQWREALENLQSTNNFPEFTGRVCPAPCEASCTLNIVDNPVTIKTIECQIVDRGWDEGWIRPQMSPRGTGKRVAVVGSGPAGLACAQQLARAGHAVHVFERYARAGGLLRYGIPDFKMEKQIIDRRVAQMEAEGVVFHYNVDIGVTRPFRSLLDRFDAVLLAGGAERPRDLTLPGIDLVGCHYAMPYLIQQNRRLAGEPLGDEEDILAGGRHVVVIGGGDTASDCIGTAFRQGALSVTQLDIRQEPPEREDKLMVWPYWPTKFRTSTSQAEGVEREFACATLEVIGDDDGRAVGVRCARVDASRRPLAGSEFTIRADLVLIAIGFAGPDERGLLKEIDIARDRRTNIGANTDDYRTSLARVYAAGDIRKGQSLVVWAIREGRQAARSIDLDLMGETQLPR